MKSKYDDRKTGYSVLTETDLDMLHEATMDFMEDYGVSVYGAEAHEYFEGAGCEVDRENNMIKFPRNLVEDCIESTPGPGTLHARDPNRSVKLGGDHVSFTNFGVGTTLLNPYTGERSETTLEDLANITRFMDAIDEVDQISPAVTATDMPEEIKELYEAEAIFNNTSKHFAHDTEGKENTRTFLKMAAAVAGGEDKLRERPIVSLSCCPNSPLEIHEAAAEQIIESAKAGIPFEVLSMGLSGGTTPVTLAGTLMTTNCEILAGIVLGQIINKGLPMTYGSSTTIMDMRRTTSPVGAPEHAMIGAAVAQIGRYYDIPTEAGGTQCDSKMVDAQSGHEKTMNALLPALAGITSIYGMGMLEMGMTMSYEMLLIDAEIVRMTRRVMQGITVDDIHIAADILKAVGPGGTFLSQEHTRQFMRQELSQTRIFDRRMLGAWEADGGLDTFQIANIQAKEILENHKPDPLPESVQRELRRIVEDAAGELMERKKWEKN